MNGIANWDLIGVLGVFTAIMCAMGWYMHTHSLPEPGRGDTVVHTRYSVECGREHDGRCWAAVPALSGVLVHGEDVDEVRAKVSALALRALAGRIESHETLAHSFCFHLSAFESIPQEGVKIAQRTSTPSLQQELVRMASDTFESGDDAARWLRMAHPMLGGETPLQVAQTKAGAELVKAILVIIKHGGVL